MPFRLAQPIWVSWEINTACNLRCIHCRVEEYSTQKNIFTTERSRKFIDELVEMGVFNIGITGGEPFLREDLLEIVEYASDKGLRVNIVTNGSMVNPELIEKLADINHMNILQFSLDSARPERHDKIRQCKGLYDKVIRGIELGIDYGLKVGVITTVFRINLKEIPRIIDVLVKLGVSYYGARRYIPVGQGVCNKDLLEITPEEYRAHCEYWCKKSEEMHGLLNMVIEDPLLGILHPEGFYHLDKVFPGCKAGYTYSAVLATGDVVPCMFLSMKLGNINETSFRQIWNSSPVLEAIRKRELTGKCGNCSEKFSCGGCRAMAYAQTGDYLGTDTLCWI